MPAAPSAHVFLRVLVKSVRVSPDNRNITLAKLTEGIDVKSNNHENAPHNHFRPKQPVMCGHAVVTHTITTQQITGYT
jgi:hypothetical protein